MHLSHVALLFSMLLISCVSIPEKRADKIDEAIPIPIKFSVETFPELNLVDGLLDLFEDPQLTKIIQEALENNPDLRAAYARMLEAGFNFQKTRGSLFPSLSGSGSTTRTSSNLDSASNRYSSSLDVRWEVDLWGELRNRARASAADLTRAEANYEASRQSLAAQTMQSWFNIVAANQLLELAERQRESFASTHRLVNRRYENGTASITEVELAHTDVASAQADYQARKNDRDQAIRAFNSLIGKYPDNRLQAIRTWPALTRTVPAGLPSELLLARPDIIAAYQGIRAGDANARVAYADLFPSLTLTAKGGRISDMLSDLGRSAFDTWSLAGNIAAPIFEGGQRRAEVGAAIQRTEQAYQNYRKVVINAFREVEDALNSEVYLSDEEKARQEALTAARRAAAKSRRDYESGLIDLLDLLEIQRRVFTNEAETINLHKARLSNRVSLALALGKGI